MMRVTPLLAEAASSSKGPTHSTAPEGRLTVSVAMKVSTQPTVQAFDSWLGCQDVDHLQGGGAGWETQRPGLGCVCICGHVRSEGPPGGHPCGGDPRLCGGGELVPDPGVQRPGELGMADLVRRNGRHQRPDRGQGADDATGLAVG